MRLQSRTAVDQDFPVVYRAWYRAYGKDHEARHQIQKEWRTIITNPTTLSLIVEDADRPEETRVVGYAVAVFVSEAYMRWATTDMPPYVNTHAIQLLSDGSRPLLSLKQIAEANAGNGLNALITHFGWTDDTLTPEEVPDVRDYLLSKFVKEYRGYQLKEIIIQVIGERLLEVARDFGLRLRTDYADWMRQHPNPPPPHLRPYLLGVTREEARTTQGTLVSHAFITHPPRFYFTPQQQHVLRLALHGLSNEEIAEKLVIEPETVAQHWKAMFRRVHGADASLLPGEGSREGARGPEKRRRLLDYVREHPEELRPIARPDPTWSPVDVSEFWSVRRAVASPSSASSGPISPRRCCFSSPSSGGRFIGGSMSHKGQTLQNTRQRLAL